ncbi:hypothetical protein BDV98DRAFT_562137 [Pterulicium gracile]|uniref:F-box domain-containing protein n=1 Tax=Pterulicium gracile TaxID=1884261 RepID=A0A5C3QSP3_9AGAR|nr:hypothetical protein BDV98DRAFT_562137 [Pterula gracilis]
MNVYPSTLPDELAYLSDVLRRSVLRLQLSDPIERQRVTDAIRRGVKLIADLKSYQNAVAPISFLPDEVLSEIFNLLVAEYPFGSQRDTLMLVCRHWRNVAVADGRLWCWYNQASGSDRWTTLLEQRSKAYPLNLQIFTSDSRPFFQRHSHRVGSLDLFGGISEFRDFFQEFHNYLR